jgi:DegV family protein with EDD domain
MNKLNKYPLNQIRYLDGSRLRNAILGSIGHLEKHRDYLNKINVFPVPDGDTGTNMFLTMRHISSELSNVLDSSIARVSTRIADSALMGAQGNSGAVLAQFFHGFAQGVKGKWHLTTRAFAAAVENAQKAAHSALTDPKDGTILSVINDWSNYIHNAAHKTEDFVVLLENSLQTARESLAQTQHKLAVLRKAGVVDAGALGFVHLLEGIVHFIKRGKIKQWVNPGSQLEPIPPAHIIKDIPVDIKFRFCTECIVTAQSIDHFQLKRQLAHLGDSLIVAGGGERVRVHIHTDSPQTVFDILSSYGEISAKKIDDMKKQRQEAFPVPGTAKIAVVTDSSCDLPHEFITRHHIHVIPCKLIFGSQTFLDKIQVSPAEFYRKLATSTEHPMTSQPAAADVKQIYDEVVPRYDHVLSIHLPRVLSGTFQVIENTARKFGQGKITLIDGKNISCALGLVVMEAASAIAEGLPLEKVIERVQQAIENVNVFITLPTLKYLVRGGRVSKPKGIIGKILRLNPIISFDRDGYVVLTGKAIGRENAEKKLLRMAVKQARAYKKIKLIVAHADAYDRAKVLAAQLAGTFNINEQIPIVEAAPVLGVHAGPGTVGFAFTGYR